MSMPCFSRSSLWAKVQSTGSTGVSADGVFSLSALACSGWLNRNTWFFPIMIRLPVRRWGTCVSEISMEGMKLAKTLLLQYEPRCITMIKEVYGQIHRINSIIYSYWEISSRPTEIIQMSHLQIIYNFIHKNETRTRTKLDCVLNALAVDVGLRSLAGHQHDDNWSKNTPTNHQRLILKSSSSFIFNFCRYLGAIGICL